MLPITTKNLCTITFEEKSNEIICERLSKVKQCCNECIDTWNDWKLGLKNIVSIDAVKDHEVINVLVENLVKVGTLPQEFKRMLTKIKC